MSDVHFFRSTDKKGVVENDQRSGKSGAKPNAWWRLKILFFEAIGLPPATRRGWLDEKCRDEPELARQLISLLEHDDSVDRFLENPALQFDDQGSRQLQKSVQNILISQSAAIGTWQVAHEISSGGMGTVYLAERAVNEGESRKQRAAIKVIRNRVDPELFAARFRREREILAGLNHPFIARFLEGGTFDNGLPYFAVDYIEGEAIKEYCGKQRLCLTEILKLFCHVCSAVAYAHQNLVVHRDLKPSNILVARDGTPRLIDFGIAKVLASEGNGESPEQTIGIGPCTPNYSSPEQVRGEGVTTATDIFALGIILFELVTGTHPFATSNNAEPPAAFEVLRRICEEEPRALAEKGTNLDSRPGQQLKGDLGSIVLKALQKKPAQRYSSVEYLIDDIQNFLHHRPVLARPQSWWYRTDRLVRRHPTATVSISLVLIVGLVALGFTLVSDRTAKQERDYALQQRELAASAARAMMDTLASSLENMSAPIERRLELLKGAVPIFDQIDNSSRGESDPVSGAVQIRPEVQTQLILAKALHEMGDTQGAMYRAHAAESLARRLVGLSRTDLDSQFLLISTLLEVCRIGWESGGTTTDEALAEAIATLRGLEKKNDLTADSWARLDILLCRALVLKVRSSDFLADPQATLGLLTAANEYGARVYRESPSNPDSMDAYASSLEELGSFYIEWGRPSLFLEPVCKALAIRHKAAAGAPGDIRLGRISERAIARWWSYLELAGCPGQPANVASEQLSVLRQRCSIDPNNIGLESDLVRELVNYGTVCGGRRQYFEAVNVFREALQVGERLIGKGVADLRIENHIYDGAMDLCLCYRRTGDLESARTIVLTVLEPVVHQLESLDSNKLDNRFRKAGLSIAKAEIAAGVSRWSESAQLFADALDCLRQNLRDRDYPEERAFYGCHLARYGKTICEAGDLETGRDYIKEGLQVMYDLQKEDRILEKADLVNDISDAKKDLECYRLKLPNGANTIASTEH